MIGDEPVTCNGCTDGMILASEYETYDEVRKAEYDADPNNVDPWTVAELVKADLEHIEDLEYDAIQLTPGERGKIVEKLELYYGNK